MASALTDFLWKVRVDMVFPAARSHSFTVESWDPVMIWGSCSQKQDIGIRDDDV